MKTPAPTIRLTFSAVACHTPNCRRRPPPPAPTPAPPSAAERIALGDYNAPGLASHDRGRPGGVMRAPRAILFDLGGTLLRQESFCPEAWLRALPGVDPDRAQPLLGELVREFREPSKRGLVEVRMKAC